MVARPNVDFGGNAQWVVMYLVCVNLARPSKKDNRYVVLFATTSFWNVHQEFSHFLWFQIYDESNILQDGTLIDLCGATLLWRSSEGLQHSPVIIIDFMPYAISFLMHFSVLILFFLQTKRDLEKLIDEVNAGRPQCPVGLNTLVIPRKVNIGDQINQPYVYLNCGHVQGNIYNIMVMTHHTIS